MTHIALLRAVNVAGHQIVAMADLRAWLEKLGFSDVKTLLQSGNLVFGGGRRRGAALEAFLEAEATKRLKLTTDFIVRTPAEWKAAIAANPFTAFAKRDPARLLLYALKGAPAAAQIAALEKAVVGAEEVAVVGAHLYAAYPDGAGKSKLTTAVIDRTLGVRGTGRNWNTVQKLAALAAE